MCGIAGLVHAPGAPVERATLLRMLSRLAHRGPDGGAWLEDDGAVLREGGVEGARVFREQPVAQGPYAAGPRAVLGHRRLAITDRSEAGRQPMSRGGGRWWIVFNGAIYNAPELRRELEALGETFTTEADTEVLLCAWVRWGEEALARLNGMWAFAVWDARERELFCARDRFGVKPFYYTKTEQGDFAFASEPKALRVVRPAEPNLAAVAGYLATGGGVGGGADCVYASYRSLPEGFALRVGREGERVWRWYDLDARAAARARPATLAAATEEVRALLDDAVRIRLRADVPIGAFLSGGIDSSGVVTTLRSLPPESRGRFTRVTVSTRFPGRPDIDESRYIRAVLRGGGIAGEWVEPTAEALDRELDDVVESLDDLLPGSVFYAQRMIYRRAAALGLTVMLTGQGSDEIFGGYEPWDRHVASLWLGGRKPRAAWEALLSGGRRWGLLRGGRCALAQIRAARRTPACGCAPGAPLQRHLRHYLTADYLPAILRFEDRNAMAFGVEARSPFLDFRLVELARTLRDDWLLRHGVTKAVLRRALADRLPREVRWRRVKLGLPGPEEGRLARPLPVPPAAWSSLASAGWLGLVPATVLSALPPGPLAMRIRVVDAWRRRCLGGDS